MFAKATVLLFALLVNLALFQNGLANAKSLLVEFNGQHMTVKEMIAQRKAETRAASADYHNFHGADTNKRDEIHQMYDVQGDTRFGSDSRLTSETHEGSQTGFHGSRTNSDGGITQMYKVRGDTYFGSTAVLSGNVHSTS